MPSKSIFRQPGAKHFQLVHRSQRDPLVHDPEAGQQVLKPFERENVKKGKSRADLENILGCTDVGQNHTTGGEAALYGIFYDDTQYDYMQHLRQVGVQEEGVDSILIEAPPSSRNLSRKTLKGDAMLFRDISAEGLPPAELPATYESQEAIPSSLVGLQPDMDLHLRQTLEALDDDAFVDDELEDDFFQQLVADGERGDDPVELEFHDDPDSVSDAPDAEGVQVNEESWEIRFKKFKNGMNAAPAPSDGASDLGNESEGGDTVGGLPKLPVIGGKRRRKGMSDASGYSMSSSSLSRTELLQTLDERFDQIVLNEYASDQDDDLSDDDAPQLMHSREDFEGMMSDFLENYEILGGKMKPRLQGDSGVEKLDTLRKALGHDGHVAENNEESEEEGDLLPTDDVDERDRWDCETILTTYSNLENHPRVIRAREPKPISKIRRDPRSDFATLSDQASIEPRTADKSALPMIMTRPRNESKEEKKLRKEAIKNERQARRVGKKLTKEQFSAEFERQKKTIVNKGNAKTRKL